MNANAAHPDRERLSAFALGHLSGADADTIEEHLARCETCREVVAVTPADGLVENLRAARRAGDTRGDTFNEDTIPPPVSSPDIATILRGHPRYEVQHQLGAGGMGVVYRARQRMMDRTVAIKVVNQALASRPGALDRFRREIRAAAKLTHPNIALAFEAEEYNGLVLLVMEYVEGEDLGKVMQQKGKLPLRHACYYAYQTALGLQHAHEQGLVHRDIKPSNLMVTRGPKPQVKILDFGLGKLVSEGPEDAALTGAGATMGTPHYIAPEQALDARTADIRADVYSLGCTLYHLLTGKPPFTAGTTVQVMMAHLHEPAPSLRESRPDAPPELAELVARMMAKEPAARPQTPGEVSRGLRPFLTANPAQAPTAPQSAEAGQAEPPLSVTLSGPQKILTPTAKAQPAVGSRRGLLLATGLALLLAVVGGGLWAAGVFKVKTKEGVLVVEVNDPGAEVFVDGERATVNWADGGKRAEIGVKPGTRKVEVRKDGVTVHGEEVTVEDGGRKLVTARLEKKPPVDPRPVGKPADKLPVALGTYTVVFPENKLRITTELKADRTALVRAIGKMFPAKWDVRDDLLIVRGEDFVDVWSVSEGRIVVKHWVNAEKYPRNPRPGRDSRVVTLRVTPSIPTRGSCPCSTARI